MTTRLAAVAPLVALCVSLAGALAGCSSDTGDPAPARTVQQRSEPAEPDAGPSQSAASEDGGAPAVDPPSTGGWGGGVGVPAPGCANCPPPGPSRRPQ